MVIGFHGAALSLLCNPSNKQAYVLDNGAWDTQLLRPHGQISFGITRGRHGPLDGLIREHTTPLDACVDAVATCQSVSQHAVCLWDE